MESDGGLAKPAPAGTEWTPPATPAPSVWLFGVLEGSTLVSPVSTPKLLRSTVLSKLLASPYLLPHGAASGKGSEGPTEQLLLWLSFHTTHHSRWASPSPLEVCLWLKLSQWVSFPGLGWPSPAPCSSAHMHGQQMPPGEGGCGAPLGLHMVSPTLGFALSGAFLQNLPDSQATGPILRSSEASVLISAVFLLASSGSVKSVFTVKTQC